MLTHFDEIFNTLLELGLLQLPCQILNRQAVIRQGQLSGLLVFAKSGTTYRSCMRRAIVAYPKFLTGAVNMEVAKNDFAEKRMKVLPNLELIDYMVTRNKFRLNIGINYIGGGCAGAIC